MSDLPRSLLINQSGMAAINQHGSVANLASDGMSQLAQLTGEDQNPFAVHVVVVLCVGVFRQTILRHKRIVVTDVRAPNCGDVSRDVTSGVRDRFGSVVQVLGHSLILVG